MNRESMEEMWDECRDGELTGSRRYAFDEHMLDDAELRALWGAESRWLEQLKASDGDAAAPGFTGRVLARWDRRWRRQQLLRRFWRRSLFIAGGAAAAAVLTLITWTYHPGAAPTPAPPDLHPVTILVGDVTDQFQMQPDQFVAAVRDTHRMLTAEHALRMFGVPAPPEAPQWEPMPVSSPAPPR